jgi:hypothetical protein
MVGRVGVEPTTSRLSGVRSNHLSYRPHRSNAGKPHRGCRRRREPAQTFSAAALISRMKGHEDDGMFFGMEEALPTARVGAFRQILRKEVIQPQVPLRLPCYDFTPVAKPTVVACLSCELAQRLRVNPTPMV